MNVALLEQKWFKEIVITEEKVIDALSKIRESSSHPDNDIPASVMKNCRYSLALPLKIMFSRSYEQGIVPKYYKFQSITPLFKKALKLLHPTSDQFRLRLI